MESEGRYADRLVTRLRRHNPWRDTYKVTEVIIDHIGPQQKTKVLNYLRSLHLNPNVEQTSNSETFVSVDVHSSNRVFERLLAFLHDVGAEDTSSNNTEESKQKAPEIEDSEDCTYKKSERLYDNTPNTTTTSDSQSTAKQTESQLSEKPTESQSSEKQSESHSSEKQSQIQSSEKQTDSQSSEKQTESEYELIISKPRETNIVHLPSIPPVENSKEVIRSLLKVEKKDKHKQHEHQQENLQDEKKKTWFQSLFKKKRKEENQAELLRTVHFVAVKKDESSSTVTFTQGIRDIFIGGKNNLYKKAKCLIKKEESSLDNDIGKNKAKAAKDYAKLNEKEVSSSAIKHKRNRSPPDKELLLLNCSKNDNYDVRNKSRGNKQMEMKRKNNQGTITKEEGNKTNNISNDNSLVLETWTQTGGKEDPSSGFYNVMTESTQTSKDSGILRHFSSSAEQTFESTHIINKNTPVCLEESIKTVEAESSSSSAVTSDSQTPSNETNVLPQYQFINDAFQGGVYSHTLFSPNLGMDSSYPHYYNNNNQFFDNNSVVYKLKPVIASNFQNKQLFFRRVLKEFDEETDEDESTDSTVDKVDKGVETVKLETETQSELKDIGFLKQQLQGILDKKQDIEEEVNVESGTSRPMQENILLLGKETSGLKNPNLALSTTLANGGGSLLDSNDFPYRIQDHIKRGLLWGRYPDGRYGWGQCYAPGKVLPVTTWGPDYSVRSFMNRQQQESKSYHLPCSRICNLFNSRRRHLRQEMMRQKQELIELKMILYSCLQEIQSHVVTDETSMSAEDPLSPLKTVNFNLK